MKKKIRIIAIIPARGSSKGIPHKNIKSFNGKPLIHYAIQLAYEAKKRGIIADHIVSTDDEKIASVAKKRGGNVPFLRPRELATDHSAVIDTVKHAVRWWEEYHQDVLHSVLLLQPTNPLTRIEDVKKSISHYVANQPQSQCLISICEAPYNVRQHTLYYLKDKYLERTIKSVKHEMRRQDLPALYWRNGAIYITRRDLILEKGKMLSSKPLFYKMSKFHSIAIDEEFDWIIGEFLLRHRRNT
jgi:CMP-N-acetylneuraminic acid synthetase